MSYRFLEHTADVRLHLEGSNLEELFVDGLRGVFEFLRPSSSSSATRVERGITVDSSDITALLVDFLGELVRLASTYKEAYSRIIFDELSSSSLRATLIGEKVSEFGDDIKAVTYHEANIVRNEQGQWETDIVFDI